LNGIYSVRLVATDSSEQSSITRFSLLVSGQMKIGNFSLAFSDLMTPVAGLPIEIIRSYDSRDKRQGDFGVGWQLGIKNVRLEKSSTLGKLWDETLTPGFLPKYCLEPTRPKTDMAA
jgi:hypothetical protein